MPDDILMWQQHARNTDDGNRHLAKKNKHFFAWGMLKWEHSVLNLWECISFYSWYNCMAIDDSFLMVFMLYSLFCYVVPCPRHTLIRVQGWDLWILRTALWKVGPVRPARWCDHSLCRLPTPLAHVFHCRAVSIPTCSAEWTTRLLQMCNVRTTEYKSPSPKASEEICISPEHWWLGFFAHSCTSMN